MEANEYGCLSQALTVVAMLSAETMLLQCRSKSTEKKGKHPSVDLPDGSGWGDHIQLLQIFECWDENNYNINWCKDNGLQVRGMMFVKDVRKQLAQIMQKIAKGSLDVRTKQRRKESRQDYRNLRMALCVHPSSVLKAVEEGTLPDYVVYHELIATSLPYMRNVCAFEMAWVTPILEKLEKLDTNKLSGGSAHIEEVADIKQTEILYKKVDGDAVPDDRESKIKAARESFLARKGKN